MLFRSPEAGSGITVTSWAFGTVFSWFPILLSFTAVLFAFSTMISWSYYGEQCAVYLFGDIAIAISTSGNSANVLNGVKAARECGLVTIGWTGGTGGMLASLVDHCFIVPSTVTARIQESHITLGHVLCELIDEQVSPETF